MESRIGVKYRTLGNTGQRVSALGFGAMRLPTTGKETDVDEARAIEMLRYAVDRGVDYVDTAHVYHGGQSEVVIGKALKDGYRERVRLATKLPIWSVNEQADCERSSPNNWPGCKPTTSTPCSKCGYCMPCPNGVNIPVNFELYNNAAVFEGSSLVLCRNLYNSLPETERANICAECGGCDEKCPQGIETGKMLRRVEEQFR
jgi:predicted aldo/keto reductase-like oxidoreductase